MYWWSSSPEGAYRDHRAVTCTCNKIDPEQAGLDTSRELHAGLLDQRKFLK